jgi:hypothetical protein
MNKTINKILVIGAIGIIASSGLVIKTELKENKAALYYKTEEALEEGQEAAGYLKYMTERYADPATGKINYNAIAESRADIAKVRANKKATRAFPALSFKDRGPNDVGGRNRYVLIDKNNPNKLFAASAGGGLFISTNNGDTWAPHPQSDTLSSLQGSAMDQSINGDIYYATGEGYQDFANALIEGGSALPGDGIWKSTDGGVTFTKLTATTPAVNVSTGDWAFISRVKCHPANNDIVFAGTSRGLKKSVNGGTTWTNVTQGGGVLTSASSITDLEITPNGNMIIGTTDHIIISKDGGATFARVTGISPGLASGNTTRTDIGFAPSNPNHLYAVIVNNAQGGALRGVYESTNFGDTWSTLANGGGAFEPFSAPPPNVINQGFWDVCLDVSPTDENEFYLGGMQNLYRYKPADGFKPVAYIGGNEALGTEVHADLHALMYDKNNGNRLFVSCDGGVYRCLNAAANNPAFVEKNDGLNTVQALYIDANSADKIINGSQDNGTHITGFYPNSDQSSVNVYGGDGGICVASSIFHNVFLGCTSYRGDMARSIAAFPNYASFHKSTGEGNYVFDDIVDNNGNGQADDQAAPGAIWSLPMDYKEFRSNALGDTFTVMVIGTLNNMYFSQNVGIPNVAAPTWFNLRPAGVAGNFFANIRFTAIHINYDGTCIYASSSAGKIYRISGLHLFDTVYSYNAGTPATWNNNGIVVEDLGITGNGTTVTGLATDPVNGEDLIITCSGYGSSISNYVLKATNAKTSVPPLTTTGITNGLPKMPVNTVAYVPGNGKNRIIIGTESGLWGTDNAGSTWEELNDLDPNPANWHPRVPVCKVQVKNVVGYNGPVIYSGTHGRGVFSTTSLATAWPTSISSSNKTINSVSIYPNPATTEATVEIVTDNSAKAIISIYNYSGSLVKSINTNVVTGNNALKVDLNNLSNGAYLISINADGKFYNTRVIKQ